MNATWLHFLAGICILLAFRTAYYMDEPLPPIDEFTPADWRRVMATEVVQ
jgi:hypothetical protein